MQQLFTNQAANGSSAAVILSDIDVKPGNLMKFFLVVEYVAGTGTITVEASPDDGTTWVTVTGTSITASGTAVLELNATQIRLTLASAASADINAWIGGHQIEPTVINA